VSPSSGGGTGSTPRDEGGQLAIVQAVRTDEFAGVERYICEVSTTLAARGHRVAVIGGDPERMREELPPEVSHQAARTVARTAARLLDWREVDLVHVHMTAAEISAWLVHPLVRRPIVSTRHFAAERGSSPVARVVARWAGRSVARDIAISRFVAEQIAGPTELVPNGVAERPQAPLDAPVVLMLQRLAPEKEPDIGLRVWARSRLAEQGWRLEVAGAGELAGDLVRLAGDLGVSESVDFVGRVRDTDALLARASIFLATAAGEPFGLSVVEAMAYGLPVVAAAGGGHLETVADAGILFPPGDVGAAAAALSELAGSPQRRVEMGGALRRRQQELYALDRHVDRLEQVYREVVAGAGSSHPSPR
jgi:glycosyltransferase involved in cell wall biosynthesis